MASDNNIELIDRFFSNDLSEEELKDFDQRIQNDPDFAHEVNLFRAIHQASSLPPKMTLVRAQKKRKSRWFYILLSFILISIFSICYFVFFPESNPSINENIISKDSTEVKDDKFAPPVIQDSTKDKSVIDTTPPTPPSIQNKTNDQIAMVDIVKNYLTPYNTRIKKSNNYKELYRQENYAEVIAILNDQLPALSTLEKTEATLILATSLMFEQNYSKAIELLTELQQDSTIIRQKADIRWYLALSYLLNRNSEQAYPILESLQNTKYQQKANVLTSKLEPIE